MKFVPTALLLAAVSGLALAPSYVQAQDIVIKHPSWMWEEGDVGVWHKKRAAEFEAKYPGITVEETLIPNSSFENTIVTQLAAGDNPDLLPVFTNMLAPLIDAGMLEPLDDCIARSDFKDRLLPSISFAQKDGKTYGIPLTMSPQSMIYNKKLLDEAGVGVPTDLESFYAAAKAVKEKTGQWGYAFPNNFSNALFPYIQSMQWVIGMGGDWSKPDRTITANAPETIEAVKWTKRFLDEDLAPKGLDANVVRTMFTEGKVAFLFDGPWVMTQVQSGNPDLLPDVDFEVMPTPTHAAITGGAFYTIPAGSQHKKEACDYLGVINAEPAQREFLEGTLQIPGTNVQPSAEFVAKNPWVGKMADIAAKYPGGIGYAPPGFEINAAEFRQIVADHLSEIYSGAKSVEDGLNDTQSALESWAASL